MKRKMHPNSLKNLERGRRGRKPGSKNKFTTLKAAFIAAFEEIGGSAALARWARENQGDFYRLIARLLPKEVDLGLDPGPVEYVIKWPKQGPNDPGLIPEARFRGPQDE